MTVSPYDALARFPGGRLRPIDWTTLATVAADIGGEIGLARGGGVLVRAADGEPVPSSALVAAGLPPAVADHRLPHVLASPMAGRLDGHHDLADLPERLCAELLGRVETPVPRRSLVVGLDDGSGDVLTHAPDLAAVSSGPGRAVRVHGPGRPEGTDVAALDAPRVLADMADALLSGSDAARGNAVPDAPHAPVPAAVGIPRVGWIDTTDGLVSLLAVVPHGVVPARLAGFLGAVERPSTVSADRVIGLHGLTEDMAEQVVRVLAPMGMIFDASSPWVTGSA
ncbi:precorrin-3B synthase [Dietzia sp. SYD-A1]|uniref:precorrin-3B synthase n=1 Tax=Dietzia sp. SYD-A1 TaxID=2780141 RepID=UPI001891DFBF|nr:precorrin-3B synthase [Dietzia sp. SYD-A1]